jgi:hypothetical protein
MGAYLDFNLRHHLMVVAVPMTLILFAANMTRGYSAPLRRWSGSVDAGRAPWMWSPPRIFVVARCCCAAFGEPPLRPGPLRYVSRLPVDALAYAIARHPHLEKRWPHDQR